MEQNDGNGGTSEIIRRTARALLDASPGALAIAWGPDGLLESNAWIDQATTGKPVADVWPDLAPSVAEVFRDGQARTLPQADLSPLPGERGPVGVIVAFRASDDGDRARLATEASEAGWWTFTPETGEFEASAQAMRMHGLPPDKPMDVVSAREVLHPEDREIVDERLVRTVLDGVPFRSEHRVRWPSGEVRWLLSHASIREDASGRKLMGVVMDITDRNESQREVRETRSRLRALLDGATDFAIIGTDVDGRIREWSLGAEKVTGWAMVEVAGKPIDLLFTPEDRAAGVPRREMETALRDGQAPDRRWHLRKDGTRFWADGMSTPFGVDEGEHLGFVKIFWDRTQAKLNEEALIRSEARFRAVQETSVDGFMTLEAKRVDGVIVDFEWTYVNEAAARIVGRSIEGFLGSRLLELMPGNRDEGLFQEYVKVVETGQPYVRELRYARDNTDIYIRLVAAKVGDGFAVSFADLTEQRRAEEKIRESEARFRELAEFSPMFIWLADADGRVMYANQLMYRYLGITDDDRDTQGPPQWERFVHPDDLERVWETYREAAETRQDYTMELRYRNAETGDFEWHYVRGVPRYVGGRFAGFMGTAVNIHARRVAEETAAAERRLLDAVLDAMPVGVVISDAKGKTLRFNRGHTEMWGENRHAESVDEYDTYKGFWTESGIRLKSTEWAMSRALLDGIEMSQLVEYERFDRPERRSMINSGAPVRNERGEIVAGVIAQLDVTDRLRAERALRESEARLRASETRFRIASGAVTGIVFDWNLETGEVWRSEGFERVTGFRADEIPQSAEWWLSRLHPDDIPRVTKDADAEANDYEVEYRARHKDGAYRYLWERGTRLRDEKGRLVRVIGSTIDITERREEQEKDRLLSELGDAMRRLEDPDEVMDAALSLLRDHLGVDGAAYGDLVRDPETGIDRLDVRRERTGDGDTGPLAGSWILAGFGEVGERLLAGESFVVHDVERDLPDRTAAATLKARGVAACLIRSLALDGRLVAVIGVHHATPRRWTEAEVELLTLAADRCWEAIGRARSARDLRELNARLEEIVRERTGELREAIHELEGFTYSVAHDLRAPLRNIAGQVNMTAEDFGDAMPPGAMENLRSIERSAGSLGRLVDDLLEFSRLGRREARRSPVDLSEVARRVVAGLPTDLRDRGDVVVADGMTAEGDRELLAMVLENLVGNALKYSQPGRTNLVEVFEDGPGRFAVRDRGIGFDAAYAEKIFLPFERLHRAEVPGTGIGLANVRRIVEKHRGKVWAESAPGEGSVFRFTLGDPTA